MFIVSPDRKRLELKSRNHPPNSTVDVTKKEFLLVNLIIDHLTYKEDTKWQQY